MYNVYTVHTYILLIHHFDYGFSAAISISSHVLYKCVCVCKRMLLFVVYFFSASYCLFRSTFNPIDYANLSEMLQIWHIGNHRKWLNTWFSFRMVSAAAFPPSRLFLYIVERHSNESVSSARAFIKHTHGNYMWRSTAQQSSTIEARIWWENINNNSNGEKMNLNPKIDAADRVKVKLHK